MSEYRLPTPSWFPRLQRGESQEDKYPYLCTQLLRTLSHQIDCYRLSEQNKSDLIEDAVLTEIVLAICLSCGDVVIADMPIRECVEVD